MPRNKLQKKYFAIHQDTPQATGAVAKYSELDDTSGRTLTPASTASVNSLRAGAGLVAKHALGRTPTIRSVPSFDAKDSSPQQSKNSAVVSNNSNGNATASSMAGSHTERSPPLVRLKSDTLSDSSPRLNGRHSDQGLGQDSSMISEGGEQSEGQWDSTVGKAGLGKTGRVINKLVSDNDALKRDIQIERLRAEESKQAARLIEDKMERMISDYESRLLEANVTKTLLARKERQVETLTASVEAEKNKTKHALERERNWRSELERIRSETTVQVDEATSYAQLMEGRYNAISSHWRDQGDEVKRAMAGMKGEISGLVEERRADDDKIQTLRDLCDQQDSNIKELRREKEEIARKFDEYRQVQEDDLRDIKTNATMREEEQERILEESREALAKLKWALNVKENIEWAQ